MPAPSPLTAARPEPRPLTLPEVLEWLRASPATYAQLIEGACVAGPWHEHSEGYWMRRRVHPGGVKTAVGAVVARVEYRPGYSELARDERWVGRVLGAPTGRKPTTRKAEQSAVDADLVEAGWTLVGGVDDDGTRQPWQPRR